MKWSFEHLDHKDERMGKKEPQFYAYLYLCKSVSEVHLWKLEVQDQENHVTVQNLSA